MEAPTCWRNFREWLQRTAFGATNNATFVKWYFGFSVMWSQVYCCPVTANIGATVWFIFTLVPTRPCCAVLCYNEVELYISLSLICNPAWPVPNSPHIFLFGILLAKPGQTGVSANPWRESCIWTSTIHRFILMAICRRNSSVTGWSNHKRPVMWPLVVLFAVSGDWRRHDVHVTSL